MRLNLRGSTRGEETEGTGADAIRERLPIAAASVGKLISYLKKRAPVQRFPGLLIVHTTV